MISREILASENKALRLAAARESTSGSSMDRGLEMKGKFSLQFYFHK